MEARDRLRLLSLEMDMQRAWLAAYLDDAEIRSSRARRNALLRLALSIVRARSLWFAAFGVVAEWWRHRRASRA
jgi:hypothetical protein